MTRVRADDYEDKKQVILGKAAQLIARKGFALATMMDVAKACGTSKSHLYHYFPSKEDLLYGVVQEHITEQLHILREIVNRSAPAHTRFADFVDCFMQGAARSRDEHIVLMNDLKYLPPKQREAIREMEVEMTALLEGLLAEMNPGVMRQQRARKPYALLLFGMMIWTFSWFQKSGDISPPELAARISTLFAAGFDQLGPDGRLMSS